MPEFVPAVPQAETVATPLAGGAPPLFSIIIPVHDGGADFERCLTALEGSIEAPSHDVLVVDDASTDGSGERAAARGLQVLRQDARGGPAAARNAGARSAPGRYLFFLDADCELHPDALRRAAELLAADPGLDALFGSYDDQPAARGAVSQFKNLYHHWTHQRGAAAARTFWAGCGAVRRELFLALGGFDARRYAEPSIEDIELGYRLSESGGRIRLARQVQVKHLKRWTLGGLVRTDIMRRGVPWTELLRENPARGGELNLGRREQLVVLAGLVVVAAAVGGLFVPSLFAVALLAALALVVSSWSLYSLVARRGGVAATLGALPLHVLYCVSCALAYVIGTLRSLVARPRSRQAHG